MGMYPLIEEQQQARLAEAVERASQWFEVARPVMAAMFAIEDAEIGLERLKDKARSDGNADLHLLYAGAARELSKPADALFAMLDRVRKDHVDAALPVRPGAGTPEEIEAFEDEWDAFNDALSEEVVSIEAAIERAKDMGDRL
jgi:hypothetical protein